MLTIEVLKCEHFSAFAPIDIQQEEFESMTTVFLNQTEGLPHQFAFVADGVPVLIVGLYEIWDRVYYSYTVFSKSWKTVYYKEVIRLSKSYIKKMDFDRIQHPVLAERPWTKKMAKMFGFRNETPEPMKKYMYGKDCYMYAIVRENGGP